MMILQVNVLGALGLIDCGELDWKVIALHKDDPLNQKVTNLKDLETNCPHVLSGQW